MRPALTLGGLAVAPHRPEQFRLILELGRAAAPYHILTVWRVIRAANAYRFLDPAQTVSPAEE